MDILGPQLHDHGTLAGFRSSNPYQLGGPNCMVCRPRSAMTSMGNTAFKIGNFFKFFRLNFFSAAIMASYNALYAASSMGQFRWSAPPFPYRDARYDVHVDGLGVDDGEWHRKIEMSLVRQFADRLRQFV